MKAIMMILAVIASASNSTAAFHGHSSFLQTAKDRYLVDHVTNCRMASSISSCAQFCLKRWPLCRSINYREGKGRTICELNDKGLESADTESSAFVSMPGFIFGQLLNFQVSAQFSKKLQNKVYYIYIMQYSYLFSLRIVKQ